MLNTYTNEVMKALPAALRPNPYNIDTELTTLQTNQWTPHQIVEYVIKNGDRTPGHVVTTIRGLQNHPNPNQQTKPNTPTRGHKPCNDKTHDTRCTVCYCTGVGVHEVAIPMPQWFKDQLRNQTTNQLQGWDTNHQTTP